MVKCMRVSPFPKSPLAVPSRPGYRRRAHSPSLDALPPIPSASPRKNSRQASRENSRGCARTNVEPLPPLKNYHSEPLPDEPESPHSAQRLHPQASVDCLQSCSAWMLAHEIGVPAVLRGDFEVKLMQTKVAASERARRRRSLERRSGEQARVQARRVIRHRNLQRKRQNSSPSLLEKNSKNVDGGYDTVDEHGVVMRAEPTRGSRRISIPLDPVPGSEELPDDTQKDQDAYRLKRILQIRKRIHKARQRRADFESTVTEYDRKAILEAFEVFTDRPDGHGELLAVSTLVGCLASIGLAGETRLEHSAVVATCEELLAVDSSVDMLRLGLEALPRVRLALLEAMRPRAMEHYRILHAALRIRVKDEEKSRLSLTACVAAIDSILGDLPGGRSAPLDTKALLDDVWQRLQQSSENEAYSQGATEESFMSAVQLAREAACRILSDLARKAWRVRRHSRASTSSSWSFAPQPEEVKIAADWDMRAEVDAGALEVAYRWAAQLGIRRYEGVEPMDQRLSLAELQAMLAQLGIEPVWRGDLESFAPLEKFMWSSSQEALAKRVGNGQRLGMGACKKLVKEVRSKTHRLAVEFLNENLQGNASGKFLAGQAISSLQVLPHTPVERNALCQELQAAIGDRTDNLGIEELASVALRAQERLQRDRRLDELMLAQALGFERELQRLRAAFAAEAFAEVVAPVGLSVISNSRRRSTDSISAAQGDEQKCGGFLHTRGQVALGDGGAISASGLRSLLLRLDQPVTPKAASELASAVTGLQIGQDSSTQAEVDFAGVLIALYLSRDCSQELSPSKKTLAEDREGHGFWHVPPAKQRIDEYGLRALLVSLSMAGRLTLALSRTEQEALIVSALRAEESARSEREEGTVSMADNSCKRALAKMKGLVHMDKESLRNLHGHPELEHPLPLLVRRCRRWAFDHCI